MMKLGWAVLLILVGVAAPRASRAQGSASVYTEFSASRFHNRVEDHYMSGGTVGFVFDAFKYKRLVLSGDLQGRFVAGGGEQYSAGSIGPRVSLPVRLLGLTPYGEFLVGFGRFSGTAVTALYNGSSMTTDGEIQANGGVSKQVSPHWDAVVDYSYSQFFAYGGQFNPKTFSGGAVYHFTKR